MHSRSGAIGLSPVSTDANGVAGKARSEIKQAGVQ